MRKDEKEHIEKVVSLGCIACSVVGYDTPQVEVHHIGNGTMGKRASNFEVIPLCAQHHRLGGSGVAVHAGRKSFEAVYGTERELLAQVTGLINE
ncbi:recombination enhancement RecA-dependent nuclease [Vibrio phage 1.115.B._10N.222.49.B11]|nr:recombination enhancement RecA-dependent nuclease [Vibrio phage 1.115.A._10N.222.49.B11]AUR88602.1 recombination enhancement RecA-dependent nuclease [Vibrio phage 1.115.B._10N.222.49.B11]